MSHPPMAARPAANPLNPTGANPLNPTGANPITAECGNCSTKDSWVLHHVRLRGIYRRLCTACVLRLHPSSFCPNCFEFYDSAPPPPNKRLSCNNCSSFTHIQCAPNHPPPPLAFLCPPCADPNFDFVKIDRARNRAIDKNMATVLLCAAKIAASSMAKAVAVARNEAEKRVREAALCRKRARDALEHVALLAKRKEGESGEVSGSGNLGKRDVEGSPRNMDRVLSNEKVKGNGTGEKNPSLNGGNGGAVVKEEGVGSPGHKKS